MRGEKTKLLWTNPEYRRHMSEVKRGKIAWNRQIYVTKEELENLYLHKCLSQVEIAKLYNVTQSTISYWIIRYSLQKKLNIVNCDFCGKKFHEPPSRSKRRFNHDFCSMDCYSKWKTDRVKVNCDYCGSELEIWRYNFNKYYHHFCSKSCMGLAWTGEGSPCWKGGYEPYYGPNWNSQRLKALDRDRNTCQRCGISHEDYGKDMDVHHIIPFRNYGLENYLIANDLTNLICLCNSHHKKMEGEEIQNIHYS